LTLSKECKEKNTIEDGYTIIENVLSPDECKIISKKLDEINEKEQKEFGKNRLEQLNEIGILRTLLAYDNYFINLILHPKVYPIIASIIGETAILHLQNAIIVYPEKKHGQIHFHRDFPKDFVSTKPLALNTQKLRLVRIYLQDKRIKSKLF